ncbi:MAG: ATP phosphoribosyltransferase regulatory subunit [Lawsonibacter sp.]
MCWTLSDVSFVGSLLDQHGADPAYVRGKVLGLAGPKERPRLMQSMAGAGGAQRREQADGLRASWWSCTPRLKEGIAQVGAAGPEQRRLGGPAAALRHRRHCWSRLGWRSGYRLDFSLVNSMDYYNGVIFQGFLPGLHTPVLSGGRYDNLPRKMGKQVGAIGFALSMGLLEERAWTGATVRRRRAAHLWARRGAGRAGSLRRGPAGRPAARSAVSGRRGAPAQLRCRTESPRTTDGIGTGGGAGL